jgi:uncharacterized membrane protein YhhN
VGGLSISVLVFAVLFAAAIVGVEARKPLLFGICKPATTLSLLLIAPIDGPMTWAISLGIVVAAVGDAVLISERPLAFMTGLVLFLVAHLCYAVAFARGAARVDWGLPALLAAFVALSSVLLVRRLWADIQASLRGPLVVYTLAITVMAGMAILTLSGPWPARVSGVAAVGAVLFFLSDSNLAWTRWGKPYAHGQTVTLVTYWLGQLGIALAARWAAEI